MYIQYIYIYIYTYTYIHTYNIRIYNIYETFQILLMFLLRVLCPKAG